jgi:hypothetical protein
LPFDPGFWDFEAGFDEMRITVAPSAVEPARAPLSAVLL